MSFLTPLYLLAGLAILAPIFAHLVRKKPREVMDFSSVIFMDANPPKLTSRNRVDQWFLLLLRLLILLAMALAFARPYFKTLLQQDRTDRPVVKRILLVDASASMRRDGIWEQAIQKAKNYITACAPEDIIGVYAVTDQMVSLLSLDQSRDSAPSERQSIASKSLETLVPSWYSCDLGRGMLQALDILKQEENGDDSIKIGEIAIVSDFQEGNSIESLGSIQWPSEVSVIPLVCQAKYLGNAAIAILPKSDDSTVSAQAIERVSIRNSSRSTIEKFTLRWLDAQGARLASESLDVFVPAGQQQIVQFSQPDSRAHPSDAPLVLELEGDDQPFDNRQFVYRGKRRMSKAWCIDSQGQDPKNSLWYFATRVPLSQPGLDIEWEVKDPVDGFSESAAKPPSWVVASSSMDKLWANGLKESIERGLHVFWVLDRHKESIDAKRIEEIWKLWFPDDSVKITEGTQSNYQLLENIDMSHPVFAAFADPKFNDFTKIRFWHHRSIQGIQDESWKVLARFDNQAPALLERSLGKGSVTVLAAGWQPTESQLALSSKFVPILSSMFEQASPLRPLPQFFCGDAIPGVPAGRFDSPGIFPDREADEFFAVNIPRSESLTDPIDLEEFARFGISLDRKLPTDLAREESSRKHQLAEQLEANQRGWWWILLAVILIAGLESIFAAVRARFVQTQATSS